MHYRPSKERSFKYHGFELYNGWFNRDNKRWQSTNIKLSAGRYLAGDVVATLDVGKTCSNGVSVGAWLTKTNVSAERFGEGSFDKGLYLRIPFDVMTTTRSGNVANLVYSPLTRDGGARLNRDFPLYYVTNACSARETSYAPALSSHSIGKY